jgi:hypothetical protein
MCRTIATEILDHATIATQQASEIGLELGHYAIIRSGKEILVICFSSVEPEHVSIEMHAHWEPETGLNRELGNELD